MAKEEDDDFTFGDFTFASFTSSTPTNLNTTIVSHPNLPPISTNKKLDDDYDEWGDFVKTPFGSTDDNLQDQLKPFDPLSLGSENGSAKSAGSKTPLGKLKGPLPLSLFGDDEDEEVGEKISDVNGVQGARGEDSVANVGHNKVSLVSSSSLKKSGFSDIISDLYTSNNDNNSGTTSNNSQNKEIHVEDRFSFDFYQKGSNLESKDSFFESGFFGFLSGLDGVKKSNENGDQKAKSNDNEDHKAKNVNEINTGFNFSGWEVELSEPNSAPSLAHQTKQGKTVNDDFSFDSNRLVSSATASTSNTREFGFDFGVWGLVSNGGRTNAGMLNSSTDVNCLTDFDKGGNDKGEDNCDEDEEDEDDGWEFKGAISENKDSHGIDIPLDSDYNSNGCSPKKVVSLTSKNEELDGSDNNGNNHDNNEQRGFQEGNARHTIDKVGPMHEPSSTSTYSTGYSEGSYNAVDLFWNSDGLNYFIPMGSGVSIDSSNFAQESNSLAAPINFTPDFLLRSGPSEGKAQLSSSDITIEDAETDDDFGEFTAAFSETGSNRETDSKVNDISAAGTDAVISPSLGQVNDGQQQKSRLEASMSSSVSGSSHRILDLFAMSNGSTDLFSMTNAIDGTSPEVQTGSDVLSINAADILGVAPTHQGNAQESNGEGLNPHSVPKSGENEDNFGDFAVAFSEAGQEAVKASSPPQSEREESAAGKDLGTGSDAGNKPGALPLSLFGYEESEVDTNILNTYTHSRSVSQSSGPSPKSAVSINDLISNLYSQAEQSSTHKFIGATDSGAGPTKEIMSESVHGGDDSNDESWEFKDSFVNEGISKETLSPEAASCSIPSKGNDYLNFYSKLQDMLYFLIKCHLENLKKDGESGKMMAVDEEIQDELKEHAQGAVVTKEDGFEGQTTTDASLHELTEALKDPKLQILEAEYDLSIKLSSAEKDLKSALELKRHAKTMISLLSLGSLEDHLMYVNLWSKMISTCAQELKAGGKILEQSLKGNVKNELLSETQGKEFIKALGEIYRVAMVLGVSARLYKPWTLECSAESTQIFGFLDECQCVWSTSGLGKALLDILRLESNNEDDVLPSIVESVQYIDNLDVPALIDHVFNLQDSRCGLSLLTLDVIPGMKTVVWDGKTYFVKLANLWANMISRDPPRVPPLHEMVDQKAG